MKLVTTTIFLALVSIQANADGFYQQIVGDAPQAVGQEFKATETINYSPLYNKVTSSAADLAAEETNGAHTEFSYTPLYQRVVGVQKPWGSNERIAQYNADTAYHN
jgi:hypothetical protein